MPLTIALVVVAALAVLLAFAATRPAAFTVQRSATIPAPAERIFPYLDDFRRWEAWSPWEKLDPELRRTFSGAERGPGAVYAWEGNKKVGQGRMEILESEPPSRLRIRLDFIKPFAARNDTVFTLAPAAGGTRMTWTMHGHRTFVFKLMGIFINMDRLIGADFERGFAKLKSVAETEPASQPA